MLPIVLLMGLETLRRLDGANTDDVGLVVDMNWLHHAYLELAPELELYFVAGHHDDPASLQQSRTARAIAQASAVLCPAHLPS